MADPRKDKRETNIPILKLEELFWHCQQAVEGNMPVSLNYLSKMTGLRIKDVSRQLDYAGLPKLYPQLRKGWLKKQFASVQQKKSASKTVKTCFLVLIYLFSLVCLIF